MKRLLFPLMLIAVIALVLYAPIRYNFIYPIGGADAPIHIQSLISITEALSNSLHLDYYGIISLLPFTLAGLDSITVFFWFNYIVLISTFISLWFLLRPFYGLPAALLSFPLSVLIAEGVWHQFNSGTIFNIANLYIFGILAITCLALWLKYGSLKYLVLSGVLFLITSVYHSVSYLYILASMGLFFIGFLVYKLIRHESYARLIYSAGVFCLSIPLAYFTWFGNSVPEQRIVQMPTTPVVKVPPFRFAGPITDYLSTTAIVAILFILVILCIILLYRKGSKLIRKGLTDKLNQPLTYILLSFLAVFTIGAFTILGSNSDRFMVGLISFGGIFASVLLGITFGNLWKYRGELKELYPGMYRSIPSIILGVSLIGIVIGTIVSVGQWTSNYSAIKSIDIKAINYLNSLEGETEVLVSPEIVQRIYKLYVKDNINFTDKLDRQPDYIIYRNIGMTGATEHGYSRYIGGYVQYRNGITYTDGIAKLKKDWADYERYNLTEEPIVTYRDKQLIIKIWMR